MKPKKNKDMLVGTWVCDDDFSSDVEYTVTLTGATYQVTAIDVTDGESGEVRDVGTDKDGRLLFSVYWASSGRFVKCSFLLTSRKQVAFTYTFTDHDTMHRKPFNHAAQSTARTLAEPGR